MSNQKVNMFLREPIHMGAGLERKCPNVPKTIKGCLLGPPSFWWEMYKVGFSGMSLPNGDFPLQCPSPKDVEIKEMHSEEVVMGFHATLFLLNRDFPLQCPPKSQRMWKLKRCILKRW
jgi:hypothetical protein